MFKYCFVLLSIVFTFSCADLEQPCRNEYSKFIELILINKFQTSVHGTLSLSYYDTELQDLIGAFRFDNNVESKSSVSITEKEKERKSIINKRIKDYSRTKYHINAPAYSSKSTVLSFEYFSQNAYVFSFLGENFKRLSGEVNLGCLKSASYGDLVNSKGSSNISKSNFEVLYFSEVAIGRENNRAVLSLFIDCKNPTNIICYFEKIKGRWVLLYAFDNC